MIPKMHAQSWRYDVSEQQQKHAAGDGDKLCFKYLSSGSCPREPETELNRFQKRLKTYHKNLWKEVVFFEWLSKRGTHANLQAIPVPSHRAGAFESIFSLAAEKLGFQFICSRLTDNIFVSSLAALAIV
ncbi:hypothetical protein NL676_035852 [Syzygium grande]|nr:hypothetical protein NL676_035852 [Syzygium grande]